jgi:hypothetical protein
MQDLFLNNQPDALIIQILFCYKTLHVLGNLFAHQDFSTVHLELVSFMQVFDDRFQAESGPHFTCQVHSLILSIHNPSEVIMALGFRVPDLDHKLNLWEIVKTN